MRTRSLARIVIILLAAGALTAAGCKKKEASAPAPGGKPGAARGARMSFPVEVEKVGVQSLIFSVNAVGAVEAFEKVQVTSRVAGIVDRVMFSEGSYVNPGDALVEIEPERFTLTVESAQATYDRAVASKADAEAGLKRREAVSVQNPGLIPGEELETWRTKVRLAAADMAQTQAALNQAKLNLRDAYVRAPFGGAVQTRTVQTGQYVQVGTVLATLVRRDPLLLRFRVPERDAAQLRPGHRGQLPGPGQPEDLHGAADAHRGLGRRGLAHGRSDRPRSATRPTRPCGPAPSSRSPSPSASRAKPPSSARPPSGRANAASSPSSSRTAWPGSAS